MGPPAAVAAVRLAVRRSLRDLGPGDAVLVACSGGADSLALAAALAFEAERAGWRAGGITVDHGLQEGSAARATGVATTLAGLGLAPAETRTVQVVAGGGPEAAARTARYFALDEAAERFGAPVVLLGHTRDDQAETVLLGLARGSGARSLSGMAAVTGRYRRPLLGLSRAVVRAACLAEGLTPWEDPQNADTAFTRVRVRTRVLPVLESELGGAGGDRISKALARTADLLRDDADALDSWTDQVFGETVTAPVGGVHADVALLEKLPTAIRRRVLRRAVIAAGAPATDLSATHVDRVEALVTDWHGQARIDLPGNVSAVRNGAEIVLRAGGSAGAGSLVSEA